MPFSSVVERPTPVILDREVGKVVGSIPTRTSFTERMVKQYGKGGGSSLNVGEKTAMMNAE